MHALDHLTIIAPTLSEGVDHARECLDLDIPFGSQHIYMGTHNHRLQLGEAVYLEIIALNPDGIDPGRARWFGLDDQAKIRADWEAGRRLRGWVANTTSIASIVKSHGDIFGEEVSLPPQRPEFGFTIPNDGSLPMDGAMPSFIDHRGEPTSMSDIPDVGATLVSWCLEHPESDLIKGLYEELEISRTPHVKHGPTLRYRAAIATPSGVRILS